MLPCAALVLSPCAALCCRVVSLLARACLRDQELLPRCTKLFSMSSAFGLQNLQGCTHVLNFVHMCVHTHIYSFLYKFKNLIPLPGLYDVLY